MPGGLREVEHSGAKRASGLGTMQQSLPHAKQPIASVRAQAGQRNRAAGSLAGPLALPVALGRGGIKANKREGDGGTPRGDVPAAAAVVARRPRIRGRATLLPVRRIGRDDGWCEDPRDRHYNQPSGSSRSARRPARRADDLYDFIIELDHNTRPRVAGRGSAVFIHVARPGFAPTAGCVALDIAALRRLLARIGPATRIVIG